MKKTKILLISTLLLTGCASSSSNGSSYSSLSETSDSKQNETVSVGSFSCQKEISLTEGDEAYYKNYCKISTGESFTVSPKTVDTDKTGTEDIDLTLEDKEGNVTLLSVKVNIKEKATPTPEPTPTPEETEEVVQEQQQTTATAKKNTTSSNQSTYNAPQQSQQQTQVQQSQPQQSTQSQQSADSYEAEDIQQSAGSKGAAAGSSYGDQANCMAAGGTANHTCTYDALSQQYILSYQ